MDKLLSDSAKTEISMKVMDILRAYHISNWHSEPYHQNQNPAEWQYRTMKSWTNTDTIYIKTQVFRLLRYYSPAPRNIARSDWATQNITHNMTSSKT